MAVFYHHLRVVLSTTVVMMTSESEQIRHRQQRWVNNTGSSHHSHVVKVKASQQQQRRLRHQLHLSYVSRVWWQHNTGHIDVLPWWLITTVIWFWNWRKVLLLSDIGWISGRKSDYSGIIVLCNIRTKCSTTFVICQQISCGFIHYCIIHMHRTLVNIARVWTANKYCIHKMYMYLFHF